MVTSTSPRKSCTGPALYSARTCRTDSSVVSRAWVVHSGDSACTSATSSSRSSVSTTYDDPWWRYTAPGCTCTCAEPASTVPSSRPLTASTTAIGAPPVPRRSTSGRSLRVQYQPVGRRRSSPARTSAASVSVAASPPNRASVGRGQRRLGGGGAQLRSEHVRVGGVEHGRLHRGAEQRRGVVDQVGVERVVPRHEYAERVPTGPAGAAGLLPQRRQPARVAGTAPPRPVRPGPRPAPARWWWPARAAGRRCRRPLQLPPLLGQVPAAVGGDPLAQPGQQPLQARGGPGWRAPPRPGGTGRRPGYGCRAPTASASRSADSARAERRTGAASQRRRVHRGVLAVATLPVPLLPGVPHPPEVADHRRRRRQQRRLPEHERDRAARARRPRSPRPPAGRSAGTRRPPGRRRWPRRVRRAAGRRGAAVAGARRGRGAGGEARARRGSRTPPGRRGTRRPPRTPGGAGSAASGGGRAGFPGGACPGW